MRQKGFTLIEVIIVIAIIGILAAMAITRLGNSVAEKELNSAAQQMVAEIRYLQQITVNSEIGVNVYKISFTGNEYYILDGFKSIKTIKLPDTVLIYGTPNDVEFNVFTGGTINAASQTIQLQSSTLGKSLYIKIHPNRGRVRWDTSP